MAAGRVCLCLVLLSVVGAYGGGTVTIKGLYCKDPNDNTYHPVNSTWRSSTFCGNYTCKIRKKNDTTPLETSDQSINPIEQVDGDLEHAGSEYYSVIEKKSEQSQNENQSEKDINDTRRNEAIRKFEENIVANLGEKGDRYLNTAEINSIVDLLHTVKKSDLEAILEVYSLAKDIYTEIDENTLEKLTEKDKLKILPLEKSGAKFSYFYDPYAMTQAYLKKQRDLDDAASNTINSVQPTGPVLMQRNEKLVEYPMSDFHRTSSYYHPPGPIQTTANPAYYYTPQRTQSNGSCCPTSGANPLVASYIAERRSKPQFMPYPFAYTVRNSVANPYDTNLWTYPYANPLAYSHYPQPQQQNQNPQQLNPTHMYTAPVVQRKPNDYQTDIIEEIYGTPHKSTLIEKLVPTERTKKPSWQTGQLSPEVIDDIRANILKKTEKILNIIPRKKIKLERVAKVLKIDELARSKREIDNIEKEVKDVVEEEKDKLEEYEAYIVKETCGPNIEPGYFRVGNMSQPFPMCCPQKIETR